MSAIGHNTTAEVWDLDHNVYEEASIYYPPEVRQVVSRKKESRRRYTPRSKTKPDRFIPYTALIAHAQSMKDSEAPVAMTVDENL